MLSGLLVSHVSAAYTVHEHVEAHRREVLRPPSHTVQTEPPSARRRRAVIRTDTGDPTPTESFVPTQTSMPSGGSQEDRTVRLFQL